MIINTIITFIHRDLDAVIKELEAYQSEENIWKIEKNILNSAGNLALHIVGNLNTFIGSNLGKTGYIRDRPLEFSDKNVPRSTLIRKLEETKSVVESTLSNISENQWIAPYPTDVPFPHRLLNDPSTEFFMVHLTSHLAYHLGQINYHRRLLDV